MEWHARWLNRYREPPTVYGVGTLSMGFQHGHFQGAPASRVHPNQTVEEAMDEFVAWHKQQP